MLIRRAQIRGRHGLCDVRLADGQVSAMGLLQPLAGEPLIDAAGGLLLPGLHDHHIHLAAQAARRTSVDCSDPAIDSPETLAMALRAVPGNGWIRATGYHEDLTGRGPIGLPDRHAIDRLVPDRPVRIQHRTGRMWLFNSLALDLLLSTAAPSQALECEAGRHTGRLFDDDAWLRSALASSPPDLADVALDLARYGVTGATDMTASNDAQTGGWFDRQAASGAWPLRLHVCGTLELAADAGAAWRLGPAKLHLHEADLPDFDTATNFVIAAHTQDRGVAIHCVTEVELVFALAILDVAGLHRGDRIEHASVTPLHLADRIADLGLPLCVQPHFIAERGDRYLRDVEPADHASLYRLHTLQQRGIALCGGSDAPYGLPDPWHAMRAAVSRRTRSGAIIGGDEALTPDDALDLYLADPDDLRRPRRVAVGQPADLCLLAVPWEVAQTRLSSDDVRTVIVGGKIVHDTIDKPPAQRAHG